MIRTRWVAGALAGVISSVAAPLCAQDYPVKPVRFVIAFSQGGPSDILTRLIGTKLSEGRGQTFIFDNRPGAGGNVAGEIVAKAPPAGYTLLRGNNSSLATNASLYRNMSFDPVKELAPIALLASQPNILVVHPSLPVRSVKELIAFAKSRPGELNYASSGSGAAAHLAAELFKSMAGVSLVHIPYKGASPALVDMLAGQCQVIFATALSVQPHLQSHRLRPLAVSTAKRARIMPNLPTVAEAGVPGFEATTWHGVVATGGTAPAVINRLNTEINRILRQPDVNSTLTKQGAEVLGGTPQEFSAYIRAEIPKWAKVVKDSGARPD